MHTNEHLFVMLAELKDAFTSYLLFIEEAAPPGPDRGHLVDALTTLGLEREEFE